MAALAVDTMQGLSKSVHSNSFPWYPLISSAEFTYRLYRLKLRASRSKGASRSEGASSKLRYVWGQLPVQDQFDEYLSTIYV